MKHQQNSRIVVEINARCFFQQVKTSPAEFSEFRHFLDGSQYTTNGILRYEQMFGAGYVSTGGVETTKDLLGRIKLNEGEKVLDVGG